MKLNELTIKKARELLDKGEVSSREITQACLDQIRAKDGEIHAFLDVYEQEALEAADKSDARRKSEVLGPLDGIPIALKDNLMLQGKRCSAGSKILENYTAAYSGTVVRKLVDQGAVILGRTNMDEFAMGSSTEHSAYGVTKNPHDTKRVPGGSSGGSAAAVADNMCLAALGSDTGGSIRQPASLCGVVGLKPTYGRVSRYGLIAMASSLDQIGPLTKSVEDAALVLSCIQGQDHKDQTTAQVADFSPKWKKDLKGVRIGMPRQAWEEKGVDKGVREKVEAAVEELKSAGAEIKEVDLPYTNEALAVYYLVMPCEVSANLSRFDGMRYGMREKDLSLFETYSKTRVNGLGAEVRRRILLGTYALSKGYYDAYYVQAKKVQKLIHTGYEAAFRDVDALVTPTAPTTAFKIGEKTDDPLAMYLEDVFTVGANVAGLPAISIPCGESDDLPVGLHLIGNWFKEDELLAIAKRYEH
ncbi:Asp-tRNA(Asn)/Glu-tRNA(Gln) amidotransferase subunit GatA [Patescibacteria group bacterium]|nr:Asp-tRNA(Asn)/Glu-tRNA(Gln) amidotransferase subunit GatA [Patescibacteria group bacterium]